MPIKDERRSGFSVMEACKNRVAFGHGGDRPSYVSLLNEAILFVSQF
jgi:hypothetical protein